MLGSVRVWFAAAAMMFAVATVAVAADATAESFVNGIYAQYQGADTKKSNGVLLDTDAKIRKYFEPSLANLMIADVATSRKNDDVPSLDGDPFVDGQDWKISGLTIVVSHDGADKADAIVKFKNVGKAMTIKVQMIRLPAGWRIADIVWPGDEGTLRGLYKK